MDLQARCEVMKSNPYFRKLPMGRLKELTTTLRAHQYRQGDVIFHKGDPSSGLYLVLTGSVRTTLNSSDGRRQVLKVFGRGRTFGDVSVFDGETQPAEAMAAADTEVAVVPRTQLLELLRSNPEVAIDVIRLFASRLRAYKQIVEDLALRPVIARVARWLVDRARGTGTLVEESASLQNAYTQEELAAMVGSVREVVQRALKTLERAELIEMRRGRIHVIDVDALDGWTEARHEEAVDASHLSAAPAVGA